MSTPYTATEEVIQLALEIANSQESPNIAQIAKDHSVPYHRLLRRYKGSKSRSTRPPTNRLLDDAQEKALLLYIERMDGLNISCRQDRIEQVVNHILLRHHDGDPEDAPRAGSKWVERFIKRHPEVARIRQKAQEIDRIACHSKSAFEAYFKRLRKAIDDHGIQLCDIWNYDEVGFRIGQGDSQWILTLCPERSAYIASKSSRESVTCCETINVTGSTIPPLVILPGVRIFEGWVTNDLDPDTLIAVTYNGYTNDMIGLQWLKHFDRCSSRQQRGAYRLLLLDGHGSHLTIPFIEYCDEHRIIPFCLPPHSTHLLQPLDLVVFSPYKHWHKDAVDLATRSGCTMFDKFEFLAALNSIRANSFKPNTIKSAWRKAGIHPWDPSPIVASLRDPTPEVFPWGRTPTPPSTPAQETPRTIRSLKRMASKMLDREEPPSPTLQRFISGSLIQAENGDIHLADLKQQTAERRARDDRRSRRRILQSGGIVSVREARMMAADKEEEEEQCEKKKAWREWKRERKRLMEMPGGLGDVHRELLRTVKKVFPPRKRRVVKPKAVARASNAQ